MGIRTASFQGNLLTIGTAGGAILFYDVREGKYLESRLHSKNTVVLHGSRAWVRQDDEEYRNLRYENIHLDLTVPSMYTHCYDPSGTRIFTGGGPHPANIYGNYLGIWQ